MTAFSEVPYGTARHDYPEAVALQLAPGSALDTGAGEVARTRRKQPARAALQTYPLAMGLSSPAIAGDGYISTTTTSSSAWLTWGHCFS